METVATGKVEIGCFRAYPKDHKAESKTSVGGLEMIDSDKLKDFGVYSD